MTQPPQTPWGRRIEKIIENIWEPLDLIGQKLLGSLWRTFYESVQDAIALSLLLQIPSLIGKVIIGKEFSSYDVCLAENALGSSRYACFIIVTSDFLLWVVLAGRILGRFIVDFKSLWSNNRGNNNDPP
ncbi:hypothetical protein [Crocosphaera sp. XPORK-15E]|uniref:hypothetical protein n=1 Tax=Crocosphaera sp. XPORK-15E TaxID=3110247 RepID=UPI002B1F29EF|nr:hypothetical protein [Crocosphaera sp. XPORK-15E]MEA5534508.1 hypothetical protein [Crocosphaera sp. XPORK-15E]